MDLITYALLNKRVKALEEGSGGLQIHVCTSDEYDHETGVPTVASPASDTLYLVSASDATTGNLFDEWVYVAAAWEKVGSTSINVPVQDVQVDGTSILNNGVANVPIASGNGTTATSGVVRPYDYFGVGVNGNGQMYINSANADQVKSGTFSCRAITPSVQNASAFYGLAAASGDTTQSASDNAVGAYTDAAKVAIQKMLGVYQPPWELLNDITLTEEGRIDLTADANGTPYDLLGVYIRVYYAANLTAASTGYARYLVEDSDGTTLNAETGRYTAQTAPYAKFAYILRDGPMAIFVYSRATTTGSSVAWQNKDNIGVNFDFKNIQHIYMNESDVEPAGTRIQIYGQWAY